MFERHTFDQRIKNLMGTALLEINSQLSQLRKENEYLRRAVQETQSDQGKLDYDHSELSDTFYLRMGSVDENHQDLLMQMKEFQTKIAVLEKLCVINSDHILAEKISNLTSAITAATPKARQRTKPKPSGGKHARKR